MTTQHSQFAFQVLYKNAVPIVCKAGTTTQKTSQSPPVHVSVPATRSDINIASPALRHVRIDPITSTVVAFAALVGWFVGRFTNSSKTYSQDERSESSENQFDSNTTTTKSSSNPAANTEIAQLSTGENAIWLNMSLRTLWRLFRKSTNTLTQQVLQPVLDDMEFPSPISRVTITNLTMGESPALVRKIKRLPSRSLNEIQYRFGLRLVGDSKGVIDMNVAVRLPGISTDLVIPITVSKLDIDAKVWIGFTVVPYKPWVRFAQWALVKMPNVKLSISIANMLPISAVPVLSNVMNRILTKDVPREFLFPKTQVIDLMSTEETDVAVEQSLLEAKGVDIQMKGMSVKEIQASFPRLVSLFNSLDLNNDGVLNVDEVVRGLIEWGYASEADRNSIYNLLDIDNDGYIQLKEFISVWGDLQNVFVPRRFRGVINGVLLKAEGLRTPTIGFSDPYILFSVEQQETRSKKNRETSKRGSRKGTAVWNESWELFVQQPRTARLRIEVREGCGFAYYREYISPPPKPVSHSGTSSDVDSIQQANGINKIIGYGTIPVSRLAGQGKTMWIELSTGGGRVKIDVQFSEFVDPKFVG